MNVLDLVTHNDRIRKKDVFVYHEGDSGQIKRVSSKQLKRKNVRFNYYGPLLDLDLTYTLKHIE